MNQGWSNLAGMIALAEMAQKGIAQSRVAQLAVLDACARWQDSASGVSGEAWSRLL